MPRANTIIIDDATNYGLAQLYQLRGRVGRSTQRAYAYLLYHAGKRITGEAQQRLAGDPGGDRAWRRLPHRHARSGDSRRRQPAGARAGRPYRAGRLRPVHAAAGAGGRAAQASPDRASCATRGGGSTPARQSKPSSYAGRRAPSLTAAVSGAVGDGGPITPIQLVTLDLPLTAYLPTDYITDDTLASAGLPEAGTGRNLAGPPVLARRADATASGRYPSRPSTSAVAAAQGAGPARWRYFDRDRRRRNRGPVACRRRGRPRDVTAAGRSEPVRIGPQFARINRRAAGERWAEVLRELLELLAAEGDRP